MKTLELTAAIAADGTTANIYLADARLVTGPDDTPAHVAFSTRIIDPGTIGVSVFSDGRTGGASKLETGEIVVNNIDGALDSWLDYGFDGWPVVSRSGVAGDAYPSAWTTVIRGTCEAVEANSQQMVLRLRDKLRLLDMPVCSAVYGGTNVLPDGLDGTATDIKGRRRPAVFGQVLNVSPPCVNTSRNIYETGVCQSVDGVYVRGSALSQGADYTSQSDMETNAPSAGYYRAWPGGGYFRLGTPADGAVTADVTAGATAADRTTAHVLQALALAVGIPAGEIDSSDVAALDATNPAVVGIWVSDDSTARRCMDDVAASIGAFYCFDLPGMLRMGQLTAPTGTPDLTLQDYQEGDVERRPAADIAIPAWRYSIGYAKNYTVQTGDVAGAAVARQAWLAEAYRVATADDASVQDQHLLATDVREDTLLVSESDASAEASRRLALYSVRRDILDVTVPLALAAVDLMKVVRLVYPRFGCASGKDFRVIGRRIEQQDNKAVLTLWG